jgi:MoxR-like ATPase
MNEYIIDFQERGIFVYNKTTNAREALVHQPKLEKEIDLPVRYSISTLEDKLLGAVVSYVPERNRVELKNGTESATLIIGGNEELLLKSNGDRYDIGEVELKDLPEDQAQQMKEVGFTKGYSLRSPKEKATIYFFSKDGKERAVLSAESSDFKRFLPFVIYPRIKQDLEGRTLKKNITVKPSLNIVTKKEDGQFVEFVKKNFKPRMIESAFAYQDQDGEKERFFEYLDNGLRPVILNGPTGNGKSVLAKDYAHCRNLPFYFDTGNSSFRLATATGKFVPTPGNATFSPGSLTLAMIFGGLYTMEEMAQIPQDELTGLNIFLETMELPIISQFGHEVITASPNFRFVATGNFHGNYTTNELNDAFLQRFAQIKMGYPTRDNTIDIIQARAPGLDYSTAETLTDVVIEMRKEAETFSKDLGLKGVVEIAQRIKMKTDIPLRSLFEDNIVNPLTTYESRSDTSGSALYTKLMAIVDKHI